MKSERRENDTLTEVRVRRAPRLPVFLVLGAALGAIATLIVTATLGHVDPLVGFGATFGYFCLYGIPAGVVVGAIVGLLLDRRSQRRSRIVTAEREQVESAVR
ncbi:MAG: potassium transporter Trk [Pseudolysinimonas sp.]